MRTIAELTAENCSAWDTYVKRAPCGLPQHLSGWRDVLYKTNSYETHYLMAQEDGRIVGVLPLFLVRSYLVGHTAMTMPGGLCADNDQVAAELIARGQVIAQQARARRFLLQDTRQPWPVGLHTMTDHVYWTVDLRMGTETLWQQLDGNIRRQVRMARRNKLSVEIDRTGKRLGAFYDVFSRFTHQAGTPVFGRDFLEHVIEAFPVGFNIVVVYKEQQPIGAYFQLQMGKTMYGVWGAALREYLNLRPVYLAYWEILCDATAHGYHCLDMGRSPADSNASRHKGQWGGISRPVYQQVANFGRTHNGDSISHRVNADGKFQLMMQLWPKLPLSIARYLGPKLRRHVPFA